MVGDILQPTHLLFVLVVALLVLGPKRLPEVARTLGKGIRDFRGAISGDNDNDHTSFLGQDHSAAASTTPEAHEEPPAAAAATAPAESHAEPPATATATTPAESSAPKDAPAQTEPPVAPPVTPATTTPGPAPAADPQPVVPALGTQPAVTPAATVPDPSDKPSQAPDGDDAPATAVHPAGARAEQHD